MIMKAKLFVLSLVAAGAVMPASAYEGRLLRFPATNGQEVVFSYEIGRASCRERV